MNSKQYAVLGLGIFGSTVATTLAEYGCEVIAVDQDESCVERVADEVTKAVVANVTDQEELLSVLRILMLLLLQSEHIWKKLF